MIDVKTFRERLLTDDIDTLIDDILLSDEALHVKEVNRLYILKRISEKFSINEADISLKIVGSAKLGFSISEKKTDEGILPRYRSFSPISDIDISIVSPVLFSIIWQELSNYANNQPWMPWDSGKLGKYMVYGWLRPDHFPRRTVLRKCNSWWELFKSFSADRRFGLRDVRGGLFYSLDQLKRYQSRALKECINSETNIK